MTVEHIRIHLPRDGRQTSRQRWVKPRLTRQRRDRRAGCLERIAPGSSGIQTAHRLPRLAAESLDQFQHEPFGAAWVQGEDDLEDRLERLPNGKYRMPAGGEWFLAGEGKLILAAQRLGGEMVEPLKTVNVQNLRCMTTWVLRKRRAR